ncbi:hypothetical protein BCR39DRAFT_529889 [Naematelia encephala]|uniref:Fe2OG dioxygenase domain-containing protein n=1 Tax=Naematelia encephala TaxID=71784 RepID=A0A1Y2B5S1_9TREE|nr:hypothetical protein BCR39DRAFT_529889 [Naematelia encephala]
MGKHAQQLKKRKRQASQQNGSAQSAKKLKPATDHFPSPESRSASPSSSLISPEEIVTTVLTLETLCENPELLANRDMKDLKRATFALHRVIAEGSTLGSSLTSKISTALQDYRFTDALIFLFEMYTRRLPPKLGALQRWVRECDATSSADGEIRDPDAMKCLDLILRIANTTSQDPRSIGNIDGGSIITRNPVWVARPPIDGEINIWERMQRGSLFDAPPPKPYPNFKAVHHVPAHLRRPRNLYPSTVWGSSPDAIRLTPTPSRPRSPSRIDVPGVPGAFMVLDVFTPEECLQIVQAAEAIGLEKDEAAEGSAKMKTSILARNFVWLADQPFLDHFYQSILPFVPQAAPITVDGNGGGKVRGINARFRVYQYTENQVYRPHIDGAWPAAGLDKETGEYLHDSSSPEDPLWSRYTLLVYLNSDIPKDTGCTTFFLPSERVGVMEATSVRPIQGAVLCFPHGDTQGSLLHEGSAVGADGGKLVIRTDLLYEAKGFGQFRPPASVGVAQGGKAEEGLGG